MLRLSTRPDASSTMALYVSLMGLVVIGSSLQGFVFAKLLSPVSYGYYAIAITVSSYAALLQLGLLSGLSRELPVVLGKNDATAASNLVAATTKSLAILCGIGFVVYVVLLRFFYVSADAKMGFALILGFGVAISSFFFQLVILRLRTARRVLAFPTWLLIQKGGVLVLALPASYYFDFAGLLVVITLIQFLSFFYASKYQLSEAPWGAARTEDIKYLVLIGLPAMLSGSLDGFSQTLDRLFLIKAFSPYQLGLYQFSTTPVALGIAACSIISQYLAPKLLHEYGHHGVVGRVFRRSVVTSLAIGLLWLLAWPLFEATSTFCVSSWLPRYRESLPLMNLFYFGGGFAAMNFVGVTINAANRPRYYLIGSGAVAMLSFVAYLGVWARGGGLISYALIANGTLVANYFTSLFFAWFCVRGSTERSVGSVIINQTRIGRDSQRRGTA